MRTSATILILFLVPLTAFPQIYNYAVVRGDKSIGNMDVVRRKVDNREMVNISSEVEFRILFKFKVVYSLEEIFEDGVLIKGSGFNTLNGSYQKQTEIAKRENDYKIIVDGTETTLRESALTYTVSRIYFEEPEDGERTYSQTFGQWMEFEKVGEHSYVLPSPDGDNIYTYTNGICTNVEVNRDYGDVAFVMKPESFARVQEKD